MQTKEVVELCQLCHERDPDEGMKTCWECRRGKTTDDGGQRTVSVKSFQRKLSCRDCGESDPSKFYASVKTLCKKCHQVRGTASKKARIARKNTAGDRGQTTEDRGRMAAVSSLVEESDHADGDPVAVVVLKVFGPEDVALLDRLQELARRERRSISQQVLFLIQDLVP